MTISRVSVGRSEMAAGVRVAMRVEVISTPELGDRSYIVHDDGEYGGWTRTRSIA